MAYKINLLPVDLGAGRDVLKASKAINKFVTGVASLFMVILFLAFGFLFFISRQTANKTASNEALKQQVRSLENTEQKLILVKDRAQKIKTILAQKNATENVTKVSKVLASLPIQVALEDAEIDINQAKFTVVSDNSLGMASFLTNIRSSGYEEITLKNFEFRPSGGYVMTVEAN